MSLGSFQDEYVNSIQRNTPTGITGLGKNKQTNKQKKTIVELNNDRHLAYAYISE